MFFAGSISETHFNLNKLNHFYHLAPFWSKLCLRFFFFFGLMKPRDNKEAR